MCKLKPGVKVVVIDNNNLKRGVIKKCYETLETALVELEDGVTLKTSYDYIAFDTDNLIKEEILKEIVLTENKLMDVMTDVANEIVGNDLSKFMMIAKVYSILAEKLFNNHE